MENSSQCKNNHNFQLMFSFWIWKWASTNPYGPCFLQSTEKEHRNYWNEEILRRLDQPSNISHHCSIVQGESYYSLSSYWVAILFWANWHSKMVYFGLCLSWGQIHLLENTHPVINIIVMKYNEFIMNKTMNSIKRKEKDINRLRLSRKLHIGDNGSTIVVEFAGKMRLI